MDGSGRNNMGFKRTIKSQVSSCYVCNNIFSNEKEKHIDRIDKDYGYKSSNVIVVCEACKNQINSGKLKVYNILFDDSFFNNYFKPLGNKIKYLIKSKIIQTKIKYSNLLES